MQKVFVLKANPFSQLEKAEIVERLRRWGIDGQPSVADPSAFTVTTREGATLKIRTEEKHRYPVVLLSGPDTYVAELCRRMMNDVWSRSDLLLEATEVDPPDASLLVPLALMTEELDEALVEILLRALEASSVEHRRQALTAISLVPALAFAPALLVHQQQEVDTALRAMSQRVLSMCEG